MKATESAREDGSQWPEPFRDSPDLTELERVWGRTASDGCRAWEAFRAVACEVDQLRLTGQGIAAAAESLHRYQVNVPSNWTNDLGSKLKDVEDLARRALTLIESLRRFTK